MADPRKKTRIGVSIQVDTYDRLHTYARRQGAQIVAIIDDALKEFVTAAERRGQ